MSFFVSANPCPEPREETRGKLREGSPACPDKVPTRRDEVGACNRYKQNVKPSL